MTVLEQANRQTTYQLHSLYVIMNELSKSIDNIEASKTQFIATDNIPMATAQPRLCPKNIGDNSTCFSIAPSGCYCIAELRCSWIQSIDYCKGQGMNLVSIETEEEQILLAEILTLSKKKAAANLRNVHSLL